MTFRLRSSNDEWFGDPERTELNLANVGPGGAEFIAEGLKGLGKLETLYLYNINLGPKGAMFISEGLKGLGKLETLYLYNNNLGPEGARFIAEGLKELGKLETLWLHNNNLGPEGARFIMEGLRGLEKLESLSLDENNLGPEGARFIAEGLKELGKLESLYLSKNNIGPEGAGFLAEGLKWLGKLEILSLDENNIGPEGAGFIAESLRGLERLRVLYLSNNNVGPGGAGFLAEGLKWLGKLEILSLDENNLGPEGARLIAEGLRGLGKLESLSVSSNNIGLGVFFLIDGLGLRLWELTSAVNTQSLLVNLSYNLLDFTCLRVLIPIGIPGLLPIGNLGDNVMVNLIGNYFDDELLEDLMGFDAGSQHHPTSIQIAKAEEIREWAQGFPRYQQHMRLNIARNSFWFHDVEKRVQFGVVDFGLLVGVLGGDSSSFLLALEEYRRSFTNESLSLVYTNIMALCLCTQDRCSWMKVALRSLSMTLI